MKSVMKHDFSRAPSIDAPRSSFDMSYGYKTAFDAGYLIPFMCEDVLPGDSFNAQTTGFARLSTPLHPIMDNLYMDTHFFFVPLRLIWDNSRKFFGEQVDPADSIDFQLPQMSSYTPVLNDLSDYLGLPPGNAMEPVSLYHRAYNLIWNEWFRDQNLQDSVVVDTDDGPDTSTDYVLKRRGKRHDYFTSCLPWPQKGDAVSLPLGSRAPVEGIGKLNQIYGSSSTNVYETDGVGTTNYASSQPIDNVTNFVFHVEEDPNNANYPNIHVNLADATASTVNDLREAFQVQKLLERDARGGTRYSELVKNHFGVSFYDVSYRPEFLGGGSTPVNISPVPVTNEISGAGVYPGDLGAYSTTAFVNHGFTKSFVEHGIIMGLVSVRADLTYQEGIRRQFLKSTRYDIYWPSLAHLGEQAVTNAEIYYQNTSDDDLVFGYQERYAEYRYRPSEVTGLFRSSAAGTLDPWHLSQEFSPTLPTLGNTFIQETPPVDRIIAVSSEPHFIFDSYTKMKAARAMPMYGVPGMIDHF